MDDNKKININPAMREQLDAATDWLCARAEEQIEAGGWLW